MNGQPKKSKLPFFLGGCGCLSLVLGVVLLVAGFIASKATSISQFQWPDDNETVAANMTRYVNTPEGRQGNLAAFYVDFRFDYPRDWEIRTSDSDQVNYVTVERKDGDRTLENLNVGYLQSTGTWSGDRVLMPQLIDQIFEQFSRQFPGLEKLSAGEVTLNGYEGYESYFEGQVTGGDGNPVGIYMRAILLPEPENSRGVTLLMLGTSFAPELSGATDLGNSGELPAVLRTFRFGKPE